jgi:hypothetical protein
LRFFMHKLFGFTPKIIKAVVESKDSKELRQRLLMKGENPDCDLDIVSFELTSLVHQ